jgi:hypothetical protein
MKLNRKLLVVALAAALPWMSAFAQSPADLQKEIELLKGQLKMLSEKIEALSAKTAPTEMAQQVTRLEQKLDLVEEDSIKAGFKGLKVKGAMEASMLHDSATGVSTFAARDGNGGNAMLELTKEAEGGDGVNWTLRFTPGAATLLHEATVSLPLGEGARIYGGFIPDFQGYEGAFAHQNPLVTHNALFDFAGPTAYTGLGMTHALTKEVALKWMVGNIDGGNDDTALASELAAGNANATPGSKRTVGLAYRFDWTLSEYSTLGLSGAHASAYRKFNVMAVDGGYIRGDWLFNGHLNVGNLANGAYNGADAKWWGVSGLLGFKVTPRLQLSARADYLNNRENGGGNYVTNNLNGTPVVTGGAGTPDGSGLGPELNTAGAVVDQNVGANLTRLSLGTNYLVNASTQWKTEIRVDQSTGANFVDSDGNFKNNKTTIGTSVVVSF